MVKKIDLSGFRFGKLTAVESVGRDSTGKTLWACACACGGRSVATALNLKSGNTKSCGCGKHKRGAENPRTITDQLRIQERKRTLSAHRLWRSLILKRNPKCVVCGADQKLHVHHLQGYSDYPHLRTDLENGVTLCCSCHTKFHVRYGRRTGFTEADFCEFSVGVKEAPPKIDGPLLEEAKTIAVLMRQDLRKARHYLDKLIELEDNAL